MHESAEGLGGLGVEADLLESRDEVAQDLSTLPFGLDRRQMVRPRLSTIDEGHGLACLRGGQTESIAGEDHQRRAHHEDTVRLPQRGIAALDPCFGNILAEEHHIRLQETTAVRAGGNGDIIERTTEPRVAIGTIRGRDRGPAWISGDKVNLHGRARHRLSAGETPDRVESAVQVDDRRAPRLLMKSIDVLGHESSDDTRLLQIGEGRMRFRRAGRGHSAPAGQAARPIPLADRMRSKELLKLNGRRMLPCPGFVPIRRNASSRAATGAGEDKQMRGPSDERLEGGHESGTLLKEPAPSGRSYPAPSAHPASSTLCFKAMITQPRSDLWQTTSNRLWKALSAEEKTLAAAELVKDQTPVVRASVIAVVAEARKMRAVAARQLPPEAQARIVATVREPGEILASSLLVALHLGPRRAMLIAFLDALGLPHEGGVLTDEATEAISVDDLKKGCAALSSQAPSAIRIYLNTLWLQDSTRWANAREVALGLDQ